MIERAGQRRFRAPEETDDEMFGGVSARRRAKFFDAGGGDSPRPPNFGERVGPSGIIFDAE
jgi:hypothetical protein